MAAISKISLPIFTELDGKRVELGTVEITTEAALETLENGTAVMKLNIVNAHD